MEHHLLHRTNAVRAGLALGALALLVTGCQSSSQGSASSGNDTATAAPTAVTTTAAADPATVTDEEAADDYQCKKGTDEQQAACQLATIDNALSRTSREQYPPLVEQAASTCATSWRHVADLVANAHQLERDKGAPSPDDDKTLLHVVINDTPTGADCAQTLSVRILTKVP